MLPNHRTIVLVATGALLTAPLGCRSTRHEDQLQVQSSPLNSENEIDAPPSGLRGLFRSRRAPDASQVAQQGATRSALDALRTSDDGPPVRQASTSTSGTHFSFSDAEGTAPTEPPLTAEEEAMLREAFANASPEIRELARKRMLANRQVQSASPPNSAAQPAPSTVAASQTAKPPLADMQVRRTGGASADSSQTVTSNANNEPPAAEPASFSMPDLGASPKPESKVQPTANTPAAEPKPAPEASAAPAPAAESAAPGEPAAEATEPAEATVAVATQPNKETSPQPTADSQPPLPPSLAEVPEQELFAELQRRYQERVDAAAEAPGMGDVITLRTLMVLGENPDEAIKPVRDWGDAEQEYLNFQLLTLWQLINPQGPAEHEQRYVLALPQLREATQHLGAAAGKLEVRALQFCTEVLDFGRTVPFENNRFTAGQEVLLYCEVDNFDAERLSDGFEFHFRGRYQILDPTGKVVATQLFQDDKQTHPNYLRDYFLPYQFHLPKQLKPGSYSMQIELEDVKGNTTGSAQIPMEIIESASE